jgi:predicted membrane metal-binding protein
MKKLILPLRFAIAISGCLIAYFLLLALMGLHTNPIFSFLNAGITAFGIFEAIRFYKLEQGENFDYSKGFTVGILTGFISTLIFTIFFAVYATELDKEFLPALLEIVDREYDDSIGIISFVVAIMGFATSVVITLTAMQYFKKSWNIPQKQ